MLGYPPHSLPESVETWKNIIHPEDYPRVMASFQAYLDGESPEYCEEYRCRTYSGITCGSAIAGVSSSSTSAASHGG